MISARFSRLICVKNRSNATSGNFKISRNRYFLLNRQVTKLGNGVTKLGKVT